MKLAIITAVNGIGIAYRHLIEVGHVVLWNRIDSRYELAEKRSLESVKSAHYPSLVEEEGISRIRNLRAGHVVVINGREAVKIVRMPTQPVELRIGDRVQKVLAKYFPSSSCAACRESSESLNGMTRLDAVKFSWLLAKAVVSRADRLLKGWQQAIAMRWPTLAALVVLAVIVGAVVSSIGRKHHGNREMVG